MSLQVINYSFTILFENEWQEGKPMPTGRGALNVNFINGTLYAVGGSSDRPLNSNEAYISI